MSRLKTNISASPDGFVVRLRKPNPRLRQVQAVDALGVTHIRYVVEVISNGVTLLTYQTRNEPFQGS